MVLTPEPSAPGKGIATGTGPGEGGGGGVYSSAVLPWGPDLPLLGSYRSLRAHIIILVTWYF